MRGLRALMILACVGALLVPAQGLGRRAASTLSARTRVPPGFVGMMADGPIFNPAVDLGGQLEQMASDGVGSIRVAFDWNLAQPYAKSSDVPASRRGEFVPGPGGVPTDFQATDTIVAQAAQHHLSLLPVVIYPPSWDAWPTGGHVQPVHDAPFGGYLTALVRRYGPSGSFWSAHPEIPRRPITAWQIWNEPDLPYFWDTPKFAQSYVALLRVAHQAIKRSDPRAKIVLASLTGHSWRGLATIYSVRKARRLFDEVGENTYAPSPQGVISFLKHVRQTMDSHGDRHKPLIDTEAGWPSAKGKTTLNLGVATTELGQATKLSQLLPMLAADRRSLGLTGFYYYTWMSTDQVGALSPFAFSGLLRYDPMTHQVVAKPALAAFRRVALGLEGR